MELNKDTVLDGLRNGVCEVVFTKKNGEERRMSCTLHESIIPPATKEDPLSQKKVRAVSPEVCSVWDTDVGGWRSFRWDSLKDFKKEINL